MRLIAFQSPVRPGRPGHPGDLERQVVAENRWNQTLLDLFTDRNLSKPLILTELGFSDATNIQVGFHPKRVTGSPEVGSGHP